MNFLGIDIGTTSLKAAAFSDKLEQLSQATVDYTLEASGVYAEFPAEKYWDITKEGIEKATEGLEIEALSVDTQCETLILTDEDGNEYEEKIERIAVYNGTKPTFANTASAGQICALYGLTNVKCGDGLGYESNALSPVLSPVLSYTVTLSGIPDSAEDSAHILYCL